MAADKVIVSDCCKAPVMEAKEKDAVCYYNCLKCGKNTTVKKE
jgi:hypothetical protein